MTQQQMMVAQSQALAARDEAFFHLLPTLTQAELAKLIEQSPERWERYRAFKKS